MRIYIHVRGCLLLVMGREWILIGLGGVLLATSLTWSAFMDRVVYAQLTLTPYSIAHQIWLDLPVQLCIELYVYDWENAEEFERDPANTKPRLRELGPFVYEETHGRVGVRWSRDGRTISYNQTRTWRFIPERSDDLGKKATNLNPIALTVAYMSRLWKEDLFKKIANVLINRYESLFVTAKVEDWLFNGITHNLLEMLNAMRNLTEIPIPYEKFGWFYDRNGSAEFDGHFVVDTGSRDIHNLGNLLRWNNMTRTSYFQGECAVVRGSAGEIMAPMSEYQPSVSCFSPDLCSYLTLYRSGSEVVEGLKVSVYEGDLASFDNGDIDPANKCFVVGESSPTGARNVSACKMGTAAFASFPHFHAADPSYIEPILGLAPNRDDHAFVIKLDPRTGIAAEVRAGIQVNLLLQSYEWCDIYRNKPKIFVPMMWFRQTARISSFLAAMVNILHAVADYGQYGFFALAEICFITAAVSFMGRKTWDTVAISETSKKKMHIPVVGKRIRVNKDNV